MNIGGFEVSVATIAIAAVAALLGLFLLSRMRTRPNVDRHTERVNCSCGWSGVVSRYKGACPQCGATIGARIAD
jgi:hypothetical protein